MQINKQKKVLATLVASATLSVVVFYPDLGWGAPGLTANADGVGLYNAGRSRFFLKDTLDGADAEYAFDFGRSDAGWTPLVGDWNGDGIDTIGLYDPLISLFNLSNSLVGNSDYAFNFGPNGAGWFPLAGDWNGDGKDTIGLYDPLSSTFYLSNSHTGGDASYVFNFGPNNAGWFPLAGDWNSDGVDTVGFYDPFSGAFYLINHLAGGKANYVFNFGPGNLGWIPLTGDWGGTEIPDLPHSQDDPNHSTFSGNWRLAAFSDVYPGCGSNGDIALQHDDIFLSGTATISGNCMGGPYTGAVTGVADGDRIEMRFDFVIPGEPIQYLGFEGYYHSSGAVSEIDGRWYEWSFQDYGNATLSR